MGEGFREDKAQSWQKSPDSTGILERWNALGLFFSGVRNRESGREHLFNWTTVEIINAISNLTPHPHPTLEYERRTTTALKVEVNWKKKPSNFFHQFVEGLKQQRTNEKKNPLSSLEIGSSKIRLGREIIDFRRLKMAQNIMVSFVRRKLSGRFNPFSSLKKKSNEF